MDRISWLIRTYFFSESVERVHVRPSSQQPLEEDDGHDYEEVRDEPEVRVQEEEHCVRDLETNEQIRIHMTLRTWSCENT